MKTVLFSCFSFIVRGVKSEAFLVHDQVAITSGHAPRSGRNEMVVGKLAARTLGFNDAKDAIDTTIHAR